MNKDFNPPPARSWRDIPQPVKPRAMSGGGRWRLVRAGLRVAGFTAVLLAVGWGIWQVTEVLQHGPRQMAAVAKAPPVKDVLLATDGVLGREHVAEILAVPKGATLMDLDLLKLRDRLLATGQVRTAKLTLNFPSTLMVTISERSPVARIKAAMPEGVQQELLVARDGVVFAGADFDPAMLATLPWLEGFSLMRQNGMLWPISGMEAVADLLARAKLETEDRYHTWEVVSLARLRTDGEIEVRTTSGTRVVFGTREDYFRQLARLDLLLDTTAKAQPDKALREINLTLGAQVPVTFAANLPPVQSAARPTAGGPQFKPFTAQSSSPAHPNPRIKLNLEL
ncbi:MAG TPA: FtsQ-type POTRA domain-containing protein [Opitutaceae bacterium]|nr:FtsQ-type POTRA domain-containing protein [Opitutaceae bacterium]